jgi:aminopeptidase N
VPGENLSLIEATDRKQKLWVESYEIELDLTRGEKVFGSRTTVRFEATETGTSTFIDAITARVYKVTLNGEELDPEQVSDGVRIQLPNLAKENVLVIESDCNYMNTGEGLHRFVDPVDGEVYLYSQFEVPDSRRVFAVFEQPNLKATFQFTVIAPKHWVVVSNQPSPAAQDVGNDKAVWSFAPTPRLASYVTTLIAGPYHGEFSSLVSSDGRTIPLGVYVRQSLKQYVEAEHLFEVCRRGFPFFERSFDRAYPFDKYDQLFVPEFNAGAMENAGAVTITETYVFRSTVPDSLRERRDTTILHELAHMWFGDLVTMDWWNDLWLNESFAEWAAAFASAEVTDWEAWTTFSASEKLQAYHQDQLPSTHPIVAPINDLEDVQVNFDFITYAKGASVIKQLTAWVGTDAFLKGVAQYLQKQAFSNATLADLLGELEQTSGRDLKEWSKVWLESAGVNTLRLEVETDQDDVITAARVVQLEDETSHLLRPHRIALGFYDKTDGKIIRSQRFEFDVAGEVTELTELVGLKRAELLLLNDDDLAYAKIHLDPRSIEFASENLALIEDPLARTIVWTSAWESTRDLVIPATQFIDLVLNNVHAEQEPTTLMIILRTLAKVARLYVHQDARSATIARIADALYQLAVSAKPGSDFQFQVIKSFTQFAITDAQLDQVDGLLTGRLLLPGLKVDQDLRWDFISSLAVGGRITDAEIDAEFATDNTSSGQRLSALARAAISTAEAKNRAFTKLVESTELSNVVLRDAALGFGRVNDPALLDGFVDRYCDAVEGIWKNRTFKIAEYLVAGLFPLRLANERLATATRALLNRPGVKATPALARKLSENLAEIERAINAQAKDAEARR